MVDFDVKIGDYGGELVCKVEDQRKEHRSGRTIMDAEATRCFVKLRQDLPRHRGRCCLAPPAPMWLASINLACHELGDRAVRSLVEALLAGRVRVGVVELYKNQLGDASAQALATLVERSPAPGVTGLHISHNYFTPLGVELMLCAAAVCGHYPRRRSPQATERVPLWLRVERQLCKWPVLGGLSPDQQLRESQKLIGMKEGTLLSRAQARGVIPMDARLPDNFKLICIPVPATDARLAGLAYDRSEHAHGRDDYSSSCCSTRCCFASEYGPAVHLPYFWSQDGIVTKEKLPEHAKLSQRDKFWRDWAPPKCISIRDRPSAPAPALPDNASDSPPPLADDAGTSNDTGDASNVLLPVSNQDSTPTKIKSEPGLDQVKEEEESTEIAVGDLVVAEGRQGIVFWDGRPKFDFVKVRWSDDNQLSKIIPTGEVTRAKIPKSVARAVATKQPPESPRKDSQDEAEATEKARRPKGGMTLVPELKLQERERSPSPYRKRLLYVPKMKSKKDKHKDKSAKSAKIRDKTSSEAMAGIRKRLGLPTPNLVKRPEAEAGVRKRVGRSPGLSTSSSGKKPKKASVSKSPAAYPKDLD